MIAKAEAAGYTIQYVFGRDEVRLRKAGDALNASGNPNVYASVFRQGHSWGWREVNDPLSDIL